MEESPSLGPLPFVVGVEAVVASLELGAARAAEVEVPAVPGLALRWRGLRFDRWRWLEEEEAVSYPPKRGWIHHWRRPIDVKQPY